MAHTESPSGRPTAFVTGASSGIGESFARRLSLDGCNLVLTARRGDRLERLAAELRQKHGTAARVLTADLARDADVERLVGWIGEHPPLRYLVHSAGFGTRGHFADIEAMKVEAMVRVHVLAAVRLTRAALPGMIAEGRGAVIHVSSLGAFFATAQYTTYSATKSYLNAFTEGLADELHGTGVRVQALCPGLTRTGFLDTEEYADFKYERIPGWAWMQPERVVDESLRALEHGPVVFIPGTINRLFVKAMKTPVAGRLLGGAILLLSRGERAW